MAISIDWNTRVITVPKNDLLLVQDVPSEIRSMDLNWFRLSVKVLESSEDGQNNPDIIRHNTEVTLGGLTYARTIEVINGYTITFEDGQWAVNLIGANSNVADKTNVNQVSVRPQNSAGMISSPAIEHVSFNDMVYIDALNGTSGTNYPMGTMQWPINNEIDGGFVANIRGFDTFHMQGTFTTRDTSVLSGYNFIGNGMENTKMILTQGCKTSKTTFRCMTISGWQDGETHYDHCEIKELSGVHCKFEDCLLIGPMRMEEGSFIDTTLLVNCYTGWDKNTVSPALKDEFIVDLNNSSINMAFNNFNGKIKFINLNHATTAGNISINLGAGKVTIDSSCTKGTIKVRGVGELVDNSNGTIVDNDSISCGVVPSVNDISSGVWNYVIDGIFSAKNILKLIGSVLVGKVSGAETNTIKFRDLSDTKDVVTATTDTNGNRTTVTKDVS